MKHLIDNEQECPFECIDCKHYKSGHTCKAFEHIPLNIWLNAESHVSVLPNQIGDYVFTTDKPRNVIRIYGVGED